MRGGNQSAARHQSFALLGNYLEATFHHTPETVRRAFRLIAEKKVCGNDYITGEAPLSRLQDVLRHMLNRNGDIKTAIIPGH